MLLRMACNLRLLNCLLLEFSFNISEMRLTVGNKLQKAEPQIRGTTLTHLELRL